MIVVNVNSWTFLLWLVLLLCRFIHFIDKIHLWSENMSSYQHNYTIFIQDVTFIYEQKSVKDKNTTKYLHWWGNVLALELMQPLWQLSFVWHDDFAPWVNVLHRIRMALVVEGVKPSPSSPWVAATPSLHAHCFDCQQPLLSSPPQP